MLVLGEAVASPGPMLGSDEAGEPDGAAAALGPVLSPGAPPLPLGLEVGEGPTVGPGVFVGPTVGPGVVVGAADGPGVGGAAVVTSVPSLALTPAGFSSLVTVAVLGTVRA